MIRDKRGHVIHNTKGDFTEYHGHIKKLGTCKLLFKLMDKRIVPDSSYLRETVLRISMNKKYKDKVIRKIQKDKDRQQYININKGMKR